MTMLQNIRNHFTRNVIGYAALFVALGGTSYAAASIPAHSIGMLQLKNASVSNLKVRNNAITSAKVKDGSLLMRDFAPGQLRVSVKTAKGPAGPAGPPGPAGATNVTIRSVSGPAGSDGRFTATAVCNSGERAVGGGAMLIGAANTNDHLLWSRPGVATGGGFGAGSNVPNAGDTPTAWTAEMYSAVSGRTLSVYVICAAP